MVKCYFKRGMEGKDLTTTVLTCEGDIRDPTFPFKLQHLICKLRNLISDEEKPFKVTKVEPWNSVRVTFNIPQEAAQRLRQLAERGDRALRELGILSVQIEGDQVITLTLAGHYNEPQEIILRKTPDSHVSTASFDLPGSEAVPGPSSVEATRKNIAQYLSQHSGRPGTSKTPLVGGTIGGQIATPRTEVGFRSPNVVAPSSNEPIPFLASTSSSSSATSSGGGTNTCSSAGGSSSGSSHLSQNNPLRGQSGFGPFPFASMTHAMNTKHSATHFQPVLHVQGSSSRFPFTSASHQFTTSSSIRSPSTAQPTTISSSTSSPSSVISSQPSASPALQKASCTANSSVFNSLVSRVTASSTITTPTRANVALSSPLLVNLLQSESSGSQHNKLMPPPSSSSNQAPKRKRKPRKPKDKTLEESGLSSPPFSPSANPGVPSNSGLRSTSNFDPLGALSQSFNVSLSNIPNISLSPPISQVTTIHPHAQGQPQVHTVLSKTQGQPSVSSIIPQSKAHPSVSGIHPHAQTQQLAVSSQHMQGQPQVSSIHPQGQPLVSKLSQAQPQVSAIHLKTQGQSQIPNIHPQAQGQPQVHTGNLPLHTRIPVGPPPVGSPPVAKIPQTTIHSLTVSSPYNATVSSSSFVYSTIKESSSPKEPNKITSLPSSTPDTSLPSPPPSTDGKTKHLINPFTGQLEPMPSDDEEEEESIGSVPPFSEFEVDTSENGQSERSLSDGGKDNNPSSDTDSGISKSHTDISQSSTDYGCNDPNKYVNCKTEPLVRVPKEESKSEPVSTMTSVTSGRGEKLKLRLKLDPKSLWESKDIDNKEKRKSESSLQASHKVDVAVVNIPSIKKSNSGSATSTAEPRVPPLHISLRGPNAAVVVSPRKEDLKGRSYSSLKDSHDFSSESMKSFQRKMRSPRSIKFNDSLSACSSSPRTCELSSKRNKADSTWDTKKGKEEFWSQNVKSLTGGGIIQMTEKLTFSPISSCETYLSTSTVSTSVPNVALSTNSSLCSETASNQQEKKMPVLTVSLGTPATVIQQSSADSNAPNNSNLPTFPQMSERGPSSSTSTASTSSTTLTSSSTFVATRTEKTVSSILKVSDSAHIIKSPAINVQHAQSSVLIQRDISTGNTSPLNMQENQHLPQSSSVEMNAEHSFEGNAVGQRNSIEDSSISSSRHPLTMSVSRVAIIPSSPPQSSITPDKEHEAVVLNSQCVQKGRTETDVENKIANDVSLESKQQEIDCTTQSFEQRTVFRLPDNRNPQKDISFSVPSEPTLHTSEQCNIIVENKERQAIKHPIPADIETHAQNDITVSDSAGVKCNSVQNALSQHSSVSTSDENLSNSDIKINEEKPCLKGIEDSSVHSTNNSTSYKHINHTENSVAESVIVTNHSECHQLPLTNSDHREELENIREPDKTTDGLCMVSLKRRSSPVAKIITVDTLPLQSHVIEVPSVHTSSAVPKTLARSRLALEVSSIPSLIPSHGGAFPVRNLVAVHQSRSEDLVVEERITSSVHQPRVVTVPHAANMQTISKVACITNWESCHMNSSSHHSNSVPDADNKEESPPNVPSEESSLDSIEEENQAKLETTVLSNADSKHVTDNCEVLRSSSQDGKDNDNKDSLNCLESEKISCLESERNALEVNESLVNRNPSSCTEDIKDAENVQVVSCKDKQEETDDTLIKKPKNLITGENSKESANQNSPSTEKLVADNHPVGISSASQAEETTTSSCKVESESKLIELVQSVSSSSEPSSKLDQLNASKSLDCHLPHPQSSTDKVDHAKETTAILCAAADASQSKSGKENYVMEQKSGNSEGPVTLRQDGLSASIEQLANLNSSGSTSTSSIVTSLLSSGRCITTDTPTGGRVTLIFKHSLNSSTSNSHSMLGTSSSPTSVVVPFNPSKSVPIKLVTLPGGASGLSVRSTSNPAVVEIIGSASTSSHSSPSSSSPHSPSPVRLLVSKVSPVKSNVPVTQAGASAVRNRVVVKSVVVTGTSPSFKIVTAKGAICTTSPTTSSTTVISTAPAAGTISQLCSSNSEQGGSLFETDGLVGSNSGCTSESQHLHSQQEEQQYSSLSSSSEKNLPGDICNLKDKSVLDVEVNRLPSIEIGCDKKGETGVLELPSNVHSTSSSINPESSPLVKQTCNIEQLCTDNSCADNFNARLSLPNNSCTVSRQTSLEVEESPSSVSSVSGRTLDDSCETPKSINVPQQSVSVSAKECDLMKETAKSTDCKLNCSEEAASSASIPVTIEDIKYPEIVDNPLVTESKDTVSEQDKMALIETKLEESIRPSVLIEETKQELESEIKESKIDSPDNEEKEDVQSEEQVDSSLVYSKPVKRKCSENAAELIKACMGVDDSPKRAFLTKQKSGEETSAKVSNASEEAEQEDDIGAEEDVNEEEEEKTTTEYGRMNLRTRKAKVPQNFAALECSSEEEEMALSELAVKSRSKGREDLSRGRIQKQSSKDVAKESEYVNCKSSGRRSGSNESRKSDEIKGRTAYRDRKETKKEEMQKKVNDKSKKGTNKGPDRSITPTHIGTGLRGRCREQESRYSQSGNKEEASDSIPLGKRKTRGSSESQEPATTKRRRYSKDGHR